MFPEPHPDSQKIRILFVFAWLVVGGEETEVRLLARTLPRERYRIDVIPCFRRDGMPRQTHDQLRELGVFVDETAYGLSFEDTVAYLARQIPGYDVVVACQAVRDVYPALATHFARLSGAQVLATRVQEPALGADVVLCLADRDVLCHSTVLRARSPLFRAFFDEDEWTKQRWANDGTVRVQFKHLKWRPMEYVMRYFYGGDMEMFDTLGE